MDASNEHRETTPPPGIGIATALSLVLAVAAWRLVPHAWNITPVDGLCLFLGARYRSWLAFALPVALRLVTDVLLMSWLRPVGVVLSPADTLTVFGFIYASVLLYVAVGRLVQGTRSPVLLTLVGCLGVAQFFLISNIGWWLIGGYPRTIAGLLNCYMDGLPFLRNTAIAGLVGFWMFLGLHELYLMLARQAVVRQNASEAV